MNARDRTAVRTAWNNWTDSLHRDGQITTRQYETWLGPSEGKTRSSRGLVPASPQSRRVYFTKGAAWKGSGYRPGYYHVVAQTTKPGMNLVDEDRNSRSGELAYAIAKSLRGGAVWVLAKNTRPVRSGSRPGSRRDSQPNTPASRGPRNSGPVAPQARCPVGTQVQSVILSKNFFNQREAKSWIGRNDFRISKIDETANSWRFRQQPPDWFEKRSFRTIRLRPGVQAVIGCPLN